MDSIIRYGLTDFGQYEELLLRRDELRKSANIFEGLYIKTFGELMLQVFEKKIACIRLKKAIAYCQQRINRGEKVDSEGMEQYLRVVMADYNEQLHDMIEDNKAAQQLTTISRSDVIKIKKIYHRLAKQLHPDINCLASQNVELQELWDRVVLAYNTNSLEDIQEIEVLVAGVMARIDSQKEYLYDIPDLSEKIMKVEAEIEEISNSEPYIYRFLLEDPEAVEDRKNALRAEIEEYSNYYEELDKVLRLVQIGG